MTTSMLEQANKAWPVGWTFTAANEDVGEDVSTMVGQFFVIIDARNPGFTATVTAGTDDNEPHVGHFRKVALAVDFIREHLLSRITLAEELNAAWPIDWKAYYGEAVAVWGGFIFVCGTQDPTPWVRISMCSSRLEWKQFLQTKSGTGAHVATEARAHMDAKAPGIIDNIKEIAADLPEWVAGGAE